MSVRTKTTKAGSVYYVETRGTWERIGSDKREAQRVNARRKKELKAGTYQPRSTGAVTVRKYFEGWLAGRTNRSAELDHAHLKHVLSREWFADLKMEDVRTPLVQRLVNEIKAGPPKLAPKYIANIYGSLHAGFRAAVRAETVDRDPCLLEPGTISKKSKERIPYSLAEARKLLAQVTGDRLVWLALALYTGMRCGEVCGRRWSDWDQESKPLGALTVKTQYNDEPLKGDDDEGDRPRRAPVHPDLAAVLQWWWEAGYELVYLQKPTPDGFIVPRIDAPTAALTRSMTYKRLEADCKLAGVPRRGQHAARHAFITQAQRGGARKELVEQITHNAKGDMVDQYTHWEWAPLCEAMVCLPSLLPETNTETATGDTLFISSDSRTRTERHTVTRVKTSSAAQNELGAIAVISAQTRRAAAKPSAVSESAAGSTVLPRPGLASAHGADSDPEAVAFQEAQAEHAERSLRGRA